MRKLLHGLASFLQSPWISSTSKLLQTGPTGLSSRSFPVYLLFVPPVVAFLGILAITLRNQFADFTNL